MDNPRNTAIVGVCALITLSIFLIPSQKCCAREFIESASSVNPLNNSAHQFDYLENANPLKFKPYLAYMHQLGYVSGTDQNGRNFEDTTEEIRRFWIGIQGTFSDYLAFKAVSQITNDRHNYPNENRQFGHQTFRSAYISLQVHEAFNLKIFDSLTIGYGRRSGRMADEWQRSATHINTLERSAFSNKLWLSDSKKGNPLAAWTKVKKGKHTIDLALFSGTYNDWIGGWSDSLTYYMSWEVDLVSKTGLDKTDLWWSTYYQNAQTNEARLAGGNQWATTVVTRLAKGSAELHTTVAFGDNGAKPNTNRSGSFCGTVIMPMYWIIPNKHKFVTRIQYQKSSQKEGIRLNSRYARLAEKRDEQLEINAGRGDSHLSYYIGYNYYINEHNLKIVSGIKWEKLSSDGKTMYHGYTIGAGIRLLF